MADLKVALEDLKEESDSGKLEAAVVRPSARRHVLAWGAGGAVLVAAGAMTLWLGRSRTAQPDVPLTAVPFTSYSGEQLAPTFSPDGNQMAFCWEGEKLDNLDIWVKLIGAGPPLRLTTNTAEDCQPAWSPDGRSIAFLRKLPENRAAVMLISRSGGRSASWLRVPTIFLNLPGRRTARGW